MTDTPKKVKWDRDTAKWIIDNYDDIGPDEEIELEVCDECHALFKPDIPHKCDNKILVTMHNHNFKSIEEFDHYVAQEATV